MPGHPQLVQLRGTPEYAAFLDALARRARCRDRAELAERAFAHLARAHGLEPPRRCNPVGSNQHGEPKA